jgi:hypothetical protein
MQLCFILFYTPIIRVAILLQNKEINYWHKFKEENKKVYFLFFT